ncbi:hypothetical protein EV363DRAFT_1465187 [Boletus edulis]|nr:hypothetical protein EV363DRAFT_1465187 [Boletus edulis]
MMVASTSARRDAASCADPSAMAIFSKLVSTPYKSTPMTLVRSVSRESWTTGPHSLPTEIVRMIFQFMFESCINSEDCVHGDSTPTLWLDEDPLSPSLFPYALACVCLRWFRILKMVPMYWTRLVVAVDSLSLATSLHAARITLEWAGNRPLKVSVTRHDGTSETDDSEHAGVGRAMAVLRPHIRNIWSLSFNVEYSSSIPALWRERGCAGHLRVLTLQGRSDAGRVSPSSTWLPTGNCHEFEGRLKVPRLEQATFGGHFFKNPLMAHPRLASWFRHITSLTIRGDAPSGRDAISLTRFLPVMNNFSSVLELTIEDLRFDDSPPYPTLLTLRPGVLCLRRITGRTALRDILCIVRARVGSRSRTNITISDCTVGGLREIDPYLNPNFSFTNLTLASMDARARIEELVYRWDGEQLSVIDCPSMTRIFLDRLQAAPTCLSQLRIVDCDQFNAGDVIALVQSRETQAAFVSLLGGADDDAFTALAELCVRGRGPPISTKRARWLADHVAAFSWDTVARDGLRYVWDGASGRLVMVPANLYDERSLPVAKLEAADTAK